MGLCITKPITKQPKSLIRLIKVENENYNSKPTTLPDLQVKILYLWVKVEKKLNKLVHCERTHKILELKKQIQNILNKQKSPAIIPEITTGIIVEHMEKIAFEIEELIREELLVEEIATDKLNLYQTIISSIDSILKFSNFLQNSIIGRITKMQIRHKYQVLFELTYKFTYFISFILQITYQEQETLIKQYQMVTNKVLLSDQLNNRSTQFISQLSHCLQLQETKTSQFIICMIQIKKTISKLQHKYNKLLQISNHFYKI